VPASNVTILGAEDELEIEPDFETMTLWENVEFWFKLIYNFVW
jgi:hypothetical protein